MDATSRGWGTSPERWRSDSTAGLRGMVALATRLTDRRPYGPHKQQSCCVGLTGRPVRVTQQPGAVSRIKRAGGEAGMARRAAGRGEEGER